MGEVLPVHAPVWDQLNCGREMGDGLVWNENDSVSANDGILIDPHLAFRPMIDMVLNS